MTMTQNEHDIRSAARRLVDGFSNIPSDWAAKVAETIDGDECVALPMWGTLFKVEDSCDERKIRALLCPIGVSEEDDITDIRDFIEERGLSVDVADYFHGDDDDDVDDPDFYDLSRLVDDVRDAWRDSYDEDAMLADSGWEAVGGTGIIAREFDGHILLGVNGAGYDFYESHWEPLYRALGYKWHKRGDDD